MVVGRQSSGISLERTSHRGGRHVMARLVEISSIPSLEDLADLRNVQVVMIDGAAVAYELPRR